MVFNSPLGMPSKVPITCQSAPYSGVICSKRSLSDGALQIAIKNNFYSQGHAKQKKN